MKFILGVVCSFLFIFCVSSAENKPPESLKIPLGNNQEIVLKLISPSAYGLDYPDFYMSETEITNAQFKEYLKSTGKTKDDSDVLKIVKERKNSLSFSTGDIPYRIEDETAIWRNNEYPQGLDDHPVATITLIDAADFCKWLTEKNPEQGLVRLPTWNEWMVAAYGKDRKYPWGNEWDKNKVHMAFGFNYENCPKRTEPVKARPQGKTPEGIYGMFGNVDEFIAVEDPACNNYYNLSSVFMGGDFTEGLFLDSKYENIIAPRRDYWGYSHHSSIRECTLGFRIILDPKKDPSLFERERLFKQNDRNWILKEP